MIWKDYFYYKNGELYWKINSGAAKIDSIAGCYLKGHKRVGLNRKQYYIHRIIYEMLIATIPEGYQIDHINGIKDDNRIENLRLATNKQNQQNRGAQKNNILGIKGVYWNKKRQKYQSDIRVNGVKKHLGYFDNSEEASAVYQKAAKIYFGNFNKL